MIIEYKNGIYKQNRLYYCGFDSVLINYIVSFAVVLVPLGASSEITERGQLFSEITERGQLFSEITETGI